MIARDFVFRGRSAANRLSKFRRSWTEPRRRLDNPGGTGTPGPGAKAESG
jgi:hypothetical protein